MAKYYTITADDDLNKILKKLNLTKPEEIDAFMSANKGTKWTTGATLTIPDTVTGTSPTPTVSTSTSSKINPTTGQPYLADEETLARVKAKREAAKAENEAFFGGTDTGTVSKLANQLNLNSLAELMEFMETYNIKNIPQLQEYVNVNVNKPQSITSVQPTLSSQQNYYDPYQAQTDELLRQILTQQPFTYRAEDDPLYQAYKKRYQQAGEESFQNVIGDLSGMTGGRLNTWAISAAQQARQSWDERLMDVVPELYNLAYSMYRDELSNKYNQLGALGGLSSQAYERYRDLIGDQRYQQEWLYNVGRDVAADKRYQQEWEYGVERDKLADERYLQEWLHQLEKEKKAEEIYEREWEYKLSQDEYNRLSKEEQQAYDRYWQEKMWEYGVSQDEYNRMTEEEQRAYDRYWQEKQWGYGVSQEELNRAEREEERAYQRYLDALKYKQEEPPTAGQLANYNTILGGLTSKFDNPADALNYINKIGKQQYIDLIGENLYNQLLQDLQGGYQEDTIPALYSDMMKSDNPSQWLIENAPYLTTAELKALEGYLPDDDAVRIIEAILKSRK